MGTVEGEGVSGAYCYEFPDPQGRYKENQGRTVALRPAPPANTWKPRYSLSNSLELKQGICLGTLGGILHARTCLLVGQPGVVPERVVIVLVQFNLFTRADQFPIA